MAIIKSYTDLPQSKVLAKILPLESADMHYATWTILDGEFIVSPNQGSTIKSMQEDYGNQIIPCWSLTALLSVLPKIDAEEPMVRKLYYANEPKERYICQYSLTNMTSEYGNPVDACVAMIIKLHEREIL